MTSNAPNGFIAIYRWRVKSADEPAFRERWREVTRLGRVHGGYGSCLGREANGDLVAIALWPDEQARATAFAEIDAGDWPPAERLSEARLNVLDDLWTVSPFDRQDQPTISSGLKK